MHRGFSLIEILIVLVIVGISAALALPSIGALVERRNASVEVDRVLHALNGARDQARRELRCVRVTSPSTASLKLTTLTPTATGCTTTIEGAEVVAFKAASVVLPDIDVTFNRAGALDGATGPVSFIVQGKRGSVLEPHSFTIYRALGLVRKS